MTNTKDKNLTDNSITVKSLIVKIAIVIFGYIVIFMLLLFAVRCKYPLKIILIAVAVILIVIEFLFVFKTIRKRELIEKNKTFLEWIEPRKAWHITERRYFSLKFLGLYFIITFLVFFLVMGIAVKFDPPAQPDEDTLTFPMLPVFSAGAGIFAIAVYGSAWWHTKSKVKFTITGVERDFLVDPKTWKYDRIKSYHFESLSSETDIYTLLVLQDHKAKIQKMALDGTTDETKIEEILNEHGIPKNEQVM